MKRNMIQWLNELKSAQKKKSMPLLSFPGIQLTGDTVQKLVTDANAQATVMKKVSERIPSLASVSLMDLSVEAECFGSQIMFSEDEVPTVVGKVVSNYDEAIKLRVPKAGEKRTGIYIDAIKKASSLITDRPIFAGVIGSFSLAGRIVDVTEAMINCYEEPEMMKIVLEKCTQFLIEYIRAYKEAGANGVVIAEPLTGLLSPDLAEEFSEPYIKDIVQSCQSEDFILIYHNCGNSVNKIVDSILRTGTKVCHFGNAIDMREILPHIPENVIVMGNIDPAGQFKNGTPETIKKVTLDLLKDCSCYSNFVISSGCDIPPQASWENIDAYFQAVNDFYKNKQ